MSHRLSWLIAVAVVTASPALAALPDSLDLDPIRALTTQHDGRWPPLDTVARDLVWEVTGSEVYEGHDPVLLLLAWTFDPMTWEQQPLISISNAELRHELDLSPVQSVFSFAELVNHDRLRQLSDELAHRDGNKKMNPLESKVSSIEEKLMYLQRAFRGQVIKLIPNANDAAGPWRPVGMTMGASEDAVSAAWKQMRQAFLADDAAGFAAASDQLLSTVNALPAKYRPSDKQTAIELRYNRLRPFRTGWQLMVLGVLLALIAIALDSLKVPVPAKLTRFVSLLGMLAGFGVLTYGLWLRWHIAGRIPAANMFESLLFLSWGAGAFGIVAMIALRDRFVPLTASVMGALALILADCLPIDHFVRPIAPVLLDTVWMSIHVPIIMVSYAVLAVAVLIAHVQLFTMAALPARREVAEKLDWLHYWYAFAGSILLLVGIITGSMWAASSWGRYWGWDPKEVWSLVAFLGYMVILHVRVDRDRVPGWAYAVGAMMGIALFVIIVPLLGPLTPTKVLAFGAAIAAAVAFVVLRGPFATALKSVLAFWLIIMTYVGVNYVLGIGLHSYGFGTGAVVKYMYRVGGADLALVLLACVVYLARRKATAPAGAVSLRVSPTTT